MLGVVALLDEETSTFVRGLWTALTREFGFSGTHADSSPHVSFHAAEEYELEQVEQRLRSLGHSIPPLETHTNGLGMFFGDTHVLYLPVVRPPRLTVLQRAVFEEVRGHAKGDHGLYRPDTWVPHITLGQWEAGKDVVPDAIRFLSGEKLTFSFSIDNLSLAEETGEQRRVISTHRLEP